MLLNTKGGIFMKLCALTLGLMFLVAGMALAADIDGKWVGKIAGMDGNEMELNYTFKAEGATLTGFTTGPDGNKIDIQDGKIDGNNISFALAFGEMKMEMKGVVAGDQLKISMDMMGTPMEFTLKKAQ
jgi:hypothetical protein